MGHFMTWCELYIGIGYRIIVASAFPRCPKTSSFWEAAPDNARCTTKSRRGKTNESSGDHKSEITMSCIEHNMARSNYFQFGPHSTNGMTLCSVMEITGKNGRERNGVRNHLLNKTGELLMMSVMSPPRSKERCRSSELEYTANKTTNGQ